LALIGMPKTSRDTKKDCGKPGCQNDHRRKMLVRWDEMIEQAHFRCWDPNQTLVQSWLSAIFELQPG
jgi:hypothetical protein